MNIAIEKVKKEIERLEKLIKDTKQKLDEAKSELTAAKGSGDKDTIKQAQTKLDAVFKQRDGYKNDWYLMKSELRQMESAEKTE
jgi:predicted  nucleic acid-binding Zn-ribbon protein